MDADGWPGELTISGFGTPMLNEFTLVTASYAPAGGSPLSAVAFFWVPTPRRISASTTFSNRTQQPFDLYYHK